MKKILYLLLITVLFASCGDKATEETKKLILEKNSYLLADSSVPSVEIAILEGNGDYVLSSSNPAVAVAYKKVDRLIIAALGKGSTIITVKDRLGLQATIDFTVAESFVPIVNNVNLIYVPKGNESKPKALFVPPLATASPIISILNKEVVNVTVKKDTLVATGNTEGIAYAWYGNSEGYLLSSYCLKVVDTFDLNLIFESNNVNNETEEIKLIFPYEYLFLIKSGNGGYSYTITTGENVLESVELLPYTWQETVLEPQLNNPYYLHVKTKALGRATIRITDSKGKYVNLKLICFPMG